MAETPAPVSIAPPPATNTGPPTAAAPAPEGPVDPRVVALRSMFPDYEDVILQSVLESVNWNEDRAVDTLLTMSDPDYHSEQPPPQPAPTLSQTDLDEQFARQLVMQEQQQAAAYGRDILLPGATYTSRPHGIPQGWAPPAQQPNSAGGGQGMQEFQEQFNKIAETGKKTFGNIFNKVKAKIQELDQNRTAGPATTPGQQQQMWSQPGQATFHSPESSNPQAQPAYFDPNPSASPPRQSVQGYDVGNHLTPPHSTSPAPPTDATTATALPRSVSPPSTTGRATSPAPIDAGKLGILPKRPVSLLRDQPVPGVESNSGSTSSPAAASSTAPPKKATVDDDDGLEYAESPFDDTTRK